MLNILVVDDSTIIRKTLSNILNKMGHIVVAEAKNGKEAYKLYKEHNPDLVTMDITMPIMSGIDALTEIKAINPRAKVIMITSHGEERLVMDAIRIGACGYILKPINQPKIEESIKKAFPELTDLQG